ncbi:MAG TPA: branched-chain amino acid ABC transporter permease [Candidatus Limnocylindrales bacterium]|nr:branched-chain amino acid ABC transporter permease [Candidatus Limnocylindrales bacterium]
MATTQKEGKREEEKVREGGKGKPGILSSVLPFSLSSVLLFFLGLIYLVIFPLLYRDSRYVLGVVINASMLSVISLGVWLTFTIGRTNISQGAFALIGGYTTAILSVRYGISFWLCLPLSGLMAALIGALIGWPILRLRGVYFAMITLSLTEATRLAFLNGGDFTRGGTGIVDIPRPGALSIAGITLIPAFKGSDPLPFYYLAASLLILTLISLRRLTQSRIGWVFRSLRQNEELASSIGINVAKYRVMAYAICCFIGGLGGSFFAAFQQNIYPATYTVTDSIYFMLYCFLGGLDYLFGPVVGAFLLLISFELLHSIQTYQTMIYAIIMITFMLWLPNGILSLRFKK